MAACIPVSTGGAFLSSTLLHVDCQAQAIGQGGYQALAAVGSEASLVLTAALTIFIALFGYRLLFGETPGTRDVVTGMVKLGVVLAFATSWPAFRTAIYDVAFRGPAELAAQIGRPADLPGADGGLVARLQHIDDQLLALTIVGTGKPPWAEIMAGPTQPLTAEQQRQELQRVDQANQRPRWDSAEDAKRVAQGRTVFLSATIGAFAAVRLIAGLLLALGPIFVMFLLFDATRGIFEGWLRGLAGAVLGALATSILLGVQLAIMEPWLAGAVAARAALAPTPGVPIELLAIALSFALALLGALLAITKVMFALHVPAALRALPGRIAGGSAMDRAPDRSSANGREMLETRNRATVVADAVATAQRREGALAAGSSTAVRGGAAQGQPGPVMVQAIMPREHRAQRRAGTRVSAGAARRDTRI